MDYIFSCSEDAYGESVSLTTSHSGESATLCGDLNLNWELRRRHQGRKRGSVGGLHPTAAERTYDAIAFWAVYTAAWGQQWWERSVGSELLSVIFTVGNWLISPEELGSPFVLFTLKSPFLGPSLSHFIEHIFPGISFIAWSILRESASVHSSHFSSRCDWFFPY